MTPRSKAVTEALRLIALRVRPHLDAIAEHYGTCKGGLGRSLRALGIEVKRGRYTTEELSSHLRAAPHIDLGVDVLPMPSRVELEDACARWGLGGAAEEYEVSEAQICAWLRAQGLAEESWTNRELTKERR